VTDYAEFLSTKRRLWAGAGVTATPDQCPTWLYPFQRHLVAWALRKGRAALFADTGLGKTRMQLAWAAQIPGRVLILAPLCVGSQTMREGASVGVSVGALGSGERIEIANYERLHHVRAEEYAGIVLDESSILKAYDGKTRTRLIETFHETPYRLCCTATPAPNDIGELANHCAFLGIMSRVEMLATFFVHDETGWRLKGHAHEAFYRWLASWGMFLRSPADLGFSDDGYRLPPLDIAQVIAGEATPSGEYLFAGMGLGGIRGRMTVRRATLGARVSQTVELVKQMPGPWIVWCGLNDEQDAVAAGLGADCVSVQGKDSEADKEARILRFLAGDARVLVTKVDIAGFGLNLQHCAQMAFVGLGDSYEQYYQAIRRCYRFGQRASVRVQIVISPAETEILTNVRRKEAEALAMAEGLLAAVRVHEQEEIGVTERQTQAIGGRYATGDKWELLEGDCIERLKDVPADSVGLSVYSPPFIALYTYTNSERDLGNCADRDEFLAHYAYVVREMLRVTRPGRLSAVHVAQPSTTKATHGVIGLKDLRGPVIALHEAEGWVYHGDVVIDKDPQAQAIRTHSKALLFVQLRKDASWLRPALADYILVFRKPGENAEPIHPDITNEDWIEWARPIWYGIRESDTLNVREARANDDDRHVCPLQLGTIERCVRLWSNAGDLVLSPFAGIGSEGYEAVRLGRRFLGIELKPEYFDAAKKNLTGVETTVLAQQEIPL
jgi:DNA modification methylase